MDGYDKQVQVDKLQTMESVNGALTADSSKQQTFTTSAGPGRFEITRKRFPVPQASGDGGDESE